MREEERGGREREEKEGRERVSVCMRERLRNLKQGRENESERVMLVGVVTVTTASMIVSLMHMIILCIHLEYMCILHSFSLCYAGAVGGLFQLSWLQVSP